MKVYKFKLQLFTCCFLSLLLMSCEDSITIKPTTNDEYIKGDVSFLLKDSVDFNQMIDTVFTLGEIYQIEITLYETSEVLPQDSLQHIKSIFTQYPFIDTALTTFKYDENIMKWKFSLWIRGFNESNISEWEYLENYFNMIPVQNIKPYGLIKVEVGKENYWIDMLKNTNIFEWVDYNYIAHIHTN